MRSSKSIMTGVAVLAALALPMVAGAADTNAAKLVVKDSTGVTDRLVVTDMGRIGIGTSTPTVPIHIVANGASFLSQLFFANNGRVAVASDDNPAINLFRNNDPSVNSGLPRNNDRLGHITFGSVVSGTKTYLANILSNAEGAWTSANPAGNLQFQTKNTTDTYPVERLRITAAGNVGIGVAAPAQKLEVNGGVRLNTGTTKPTCSSAIRGTIWYYQNNTSGQSDSLEVCIKNASSTYEWKPLF